MSRQSDNRDIISKLGRDRDEELLLAKLLDKLDARERKNSVQTTKFLSSAERELAERLLRHQKAQNYAFWGAYPAAERTVLILAPDYAAAEDYFDSGKGPVKTIHAEFYEDYKLTHRDFLGALLGAGISREGIGDILVKDNGADFTVLSELADFVLSSFEKAGRASLKLSAVEGTIEAPEQQFKLIKDTFASLRLDALMSSAFSISRDKAAELVRGGRVKLDGRDNTKPDSRVTEGSIVSARGFGKAQLFKVGGQSKKDRTIVEIKLYL